MIDEFNITVLGVQALSMECTRFVHVCPPENFKRSSNCQTKGARARLSNLGVCAYACFHHRSTFRSFPHAKHAQNHSLPYCNIMSLSGAVQVRRTRTVLVLIYCTSTTVVVYSTNKKRSTTQLHTKTPNWTIWPFVCYVVSMRSIWTERTTVVV